MFDFYLKYGLLVPTLGVFTLAPLIAFIQARVIVRLRRDHLLAWEELGCPSALPVHPRHSWSVTRFLWRREYRSIDDARLSALCRLTIGLTIPYLILLVLGFSWPVVVLASR